MWNQDVLPDMYYSFMFITPPPLLQSVGKATFSKCLGAAFKKSSAIEGTQTIDNTPLSYLWCIKSVGFCIFLLS